jgi:hypothetical protein
MPDFPGANKTTYTCSSIKMSFDGDVIVLRSVALGGREIEQVPVFQLGSRLAVALMTGVEKPRELGVTIDPVSYYAWAQSKDSIATQRPTVTAIFIEPGKPSFTIDWEGCGYMGEEFPELTSGETTEFNVPIKFMPTRVKVNGKYATSTAAL